jgi:hypothetical protein
MEASCTAVAFVVDLVAKDIFLLFGQHFFDNYSLIKLLSWPAVRI